MEKKRRKDPLGTLGAWNNHEAIFQKWNKGFLLSDDVLGKWMSLGLAYQERSQKVAPDGLGEVDQGFLSKNVSHSLGPNRNLCNQIP